MASILNSPIKPTLLHVDRSDVQDSPLLPETELNMHVDVFLLEKLSTSTISWDWTGLESCRNEKAFLTECKISSLMFSDFFPLSLTKLEHL